MLQLLFAEAIQAGLQKAAFFLRLLYGLFLYKCRLALYLPQHKNRSTSLETLSVIIFLSLQSIIRNLTLRKLIQRSGISAKPRQRTGWARRTHVIILSYSQRIRWEWIFIYEHLHLDSYCLLLPCGFFY